MRMPSHDREFTEVLVECDEDSSLIMSAGEDFVVARIL
jgi:hypothetical protein